MTTAPVAVGVAVVERFDCRELAGKHLGKEVIEVTHGHLPLVRCGWRMRGSGAQT